MRLAELPVFIGCLSITQKDGAHARKSGGRGLCSGEVGGLGVHGVIHWPHLYDRHRWQPMVILCPISSGPEHQSSRAEGVQRECVGDDASRHSTWPGKRVASGRSSNRTVIAN